MSRPGVHNLILLVLVLVVTGVTSLNHYTTLQSTAYFAEVSQQEAREFEQMRATAFAQFLGGKALNACNALAMSLVKAETQVQQLSNLCGQFGQVIQDQAAYISKLEAELKQRSIPLPSAGKQPASGKKSAGKNLQASLYADRPLS